MQEDGAVPESGTIEICQYSYSFYTEMTCILGGPRCSKLTVAYSSEYHLPFQGNMKSENEETKVPFSQGPVFGSWNLHHRPLIYSFNK